MSDTAASKTPRYKRPRPSSVLSKAERRSLLISYFEHYRSLAATNPDLLNQKLPREALDEILTEIGGVLQQHAAKLAVETGPVKDFLELNRLPPSVAEFLPPGFRAFCLILNGLKQWVSAEQNATDKYLLGGKARDELRATAGSCVMTGLSLKGGCELHHPVRGGRPPLPLCHEAHDKIEKQQSNADASSDPNYPAIAKIRRETHNSWTNLRKGCLELLGYDVKFSTAAVRAGARSFARKVSSTTDLSFEQTVDFLDMHGLGIE